MKMNLKIAKSTNRKQYSNYQIILKVGLILLKDLLKKRKEYHNNWMLRVDWQDVQSLGINTSTLLVNM